MRVTTVLVVAACVVALSVGIVTVKGESQTAEKLLSNAASASGSLPSDMVGSKIDTGTERVLRPTVAVRTETPVYHAPSTSGTASTGSTQAERDAALRARTAAKRAAFARANGYPIP